MIADKLTIPQGDEFRHLCVLGPTGSGKTISYYLPNILNMANGRNSMLITDPKGEIAEYTSHLFSDKEVYFLSPTRITHSNFYNPLEFLKHEDEFLELAKLLLVNAMKKEDQWTSLSMPLLASALIFVSSQEQERKTIPYALQILTHSSDKQLQATLGKDPRASTYWNVFEKSIRSERTAASIKTNILNALSFYMTPRIGTILSKNEIPLDQIREREMVIFLQIPEGESEKFYPLSAVLYQQFFKVLYEKEYGLPTYCFTDELANIGVIPNLDSYISTMRSRRVSFFYGLQSIAQLEEKYYRTSDNILNNTLTKIVMCGLMDPKTLRYFTSVMGKKRKVRRSYHHQGLFGGGVTDKLEEIPVITEEELRSIKEDDVWIFKGADNPFKAKRPHVNLSKLTREILPPIRQEEYINFRDLITEGRETKYHG